ncbi:non-homologous end-joining DNA ligase [Amycolatopsis taiwanensis]|uniref:non-homologous end-joining DNA ligase n=1 Tax=Amycolatopsis taiwanensis TaxID=342230 RepID=UPI000485FAF1|nr:non-homologous end-joining DNA ligase [Amycolatopsis taiwanensis]
MARRAARDDSLVPPAIAPMLPVTGAEPVPDDPRCSYEFKWDGYRACMRLAPDGTMLLTSRNGNDLTPDYPELGGALDGALRGQAAVLDGEIIALDEQGRPDFSLLQNRRAHRQPVSYFAFDLLLLDDTPLLRQPYSRRRELLEQLSPPDPNVLAIPPSYRHADLAAAGLTPNGLLEVAARSHLEGVIAKLSTSHYSPGRRGPAWMKYPLFRTQEVVVGGWRAGQGRRSGTLGALLLGAHDPATGRLRYIGDVGTGFSDRTLDDLHQRLTPLERPASPFATEVPRDHARGAHWVEPKLVGEVTYRRFTTDGRLRHTAWRGLRPDREPSEAVVPEG